jgi:predicted DNA-binding protein (MmcQ/YjbR family)
MSKVHWNTVAINSDIPDKLVKEWIDDSYELIFKSLTKIVQFKILALSE